MTQGRGWAMAAASTALTIAVVEGVARVVIPPPRYHTAPLELDPEIGFRGLPGYEAEVDPPAERGGAAIPFALDADGFRVGVPVDAADAQVRVAFVGDSFLVGASLRPEELLPSATQRRLTELGVRAAAANWSVIDTGTGQQLALLRRHAEGFRPDAVVLALYPGNDVANNAIELAGLTRVSVGDAIRPYWVQRGGVDGGAGGWEVRWMHPWRAFGRRHSRIFAALERRAMANSGARGGALPDPASSDMLARIRSGAAPRESLELFRPHAADHRWSAAWRTTFGLLLAFRDACAALGARLLVVVIPTHDQVAREAPSISLDAALRVQRGLALDALLDWNLPERELAQFFERERIDALPLLGPLRDAARAGRRVYLHDRHLSPEGVEVAAGPIAAWLIAPPPAPSPAAAARAEASFGPHAAGPARVLPPADRADPLTSFASDSHPELLGDGWARWRSRDASDGWEWGWRLGRRALAVFPAPPHDGEIVVRGFIAQASPGAATVEIVRGGQASVTLDRAGPFEARLRWSRARAALSEERYLALIFTHPRGPSAALWVQEVLTHSLRVAPREPTRAPRSVGYVPAPFERSEGVPR